MKLFIGRIASVMVLAASFLISGIRTVLDIVGYATLPQDVQAASQLVHRLLLWLLDVPWWVPWGFAFIASITLMVVSWPRSVAETSAAVPTTEEAGSLQHSVGEVDNVEGSIDETKNISDEKIIGDVELIKYIIDSVKDKTGMELKRFLQPYLNKRIKVILFIVDVDVFNDICMIHGFLEPLNGFQEPIININIVDKKQWDRAEILRKGEKVEIVAKVRSIDSLSVSFTDGEFID
jgi:hypothetical protein